MRRADAVVSVVVPVLDEAACLPELARRLGAVLDSLGEGEVIFVDDGSSDASFEIMRSMAQADPRVRAVRLARNVGSQAAILCGLSLARGDVVISIDADLQQPPELIPAMVERWRAGDDVVHMVRRGREHESWVRAAASRAFYWLFNRISRVAILPNSADFRLLDRRCVDELAKRAAGRAVFLRALVREIGFRQGVLEYDAAPRLAGASRYTAGQLVSVALDALATYAPALAALRPGSPRPLRYEIAEIVGLGAAPREPPAAPDAPPIEPDLEPLRRPAA